MQYKEIEALVIEWADEKGILEKATPLAQSNKTLEEALEINTAILNKDKHELIDALGDTLVTIIIQAKLNDLDLVKCLESAYNVISNRTGKMINGTFIKD